MNNSQSLLMPIFSIFLTTNQEKEISTQCQYYVNKWPC